MTETNEDKTKDIAKNKSAGLLGKLKFTPKGRLNPERTKQYRSLVATLNYLIPERPDLAYATKELARRMAEPGEEDWKMLVHLGRYLVGKPRLAIFYPHQLSPGKLQCFTDSDWAGCPMTRRSTSGGMRFHGRHLLKAWSRIQQTVALSSAEAELYSSIKGASELMGCRFIMMDFGFSVAGEVLGDASAALGIIQRHGLGRLRHIDCAYLWIQQQSASKAIRFGKVRGEDNPADCQTKHLNLDLLLKHVLFSGCSFPAGATSSD